MSLAEECLRALLSRGLIGDQATQAKMVVANHAFNLLCSAWEDNLVGRHDSATNHWRSITEAPRFLLALGLNPSLASAMMTQGGLKIETAIRTIHREFAKGKYPEGDIAWVEGMKEELDMVQPFSHIHPRAISASLPVQHDGESRIWTVVPGGSVSELNLLDIALYLADAAISLVGGILFAFQEGDDLQWVDRSEVVEKLREGKGKLVETARARGVQI